MSQTYRSIADAIAAKIASGELPVGTQLAPQRTFAFETGIAVSTASRVYDELRRRGLAVGEVGRGTFVANRFSPLDPALQEASGLDLDLEIVYRLGDEARRMILRSTSTFMKRGLSDAATAPPTARGRIGVRRALAALTCSDGSDVDAENVLLAGSGKEAIMAAMTALAPRGGRIGVEALTYPFVIGAARLLGIELVSLDVDHSGLVPEALEAAAASGLDGVYVQPRQQNPLGATMPVERIRQVAEILRVNDLITIEDCVYGFLQDKPHLASLVPDLVIRIDSLSKRLMPGLAVGWMIAPPRLVEALARSVRAGGWMAPSFAVCLAEHWVSDGVVSDVAAVKAREAASMYSAASDAFRGLDFRSDGKALHGWLELPSYWRGDAFSHASAKLGIAIAPGSVFAVDAGVAPRGVRIAFSAPDLTTWTHAVRELGRIARQRPGDLEI